MRFKSLILASALLLPVPALASGGFSSLTEVVAASGGEFDRNPFDYDLLLYHVATESLSPLQVIFGGEIYTLQGGVIRPRFLRLRDNEPDLRDPYVFLPLNVQASNGVLHTVNRVLIPIDIP